MLYVPLQAAWQGFSGRIMGGRDQELQGLSEIAGEVEGRLCLLLTTS